MSLMDACGRSRCLHCRTLTVLALWCNWLSEFCKWSHANFILSSNTELIWSILDETSDCGLHVSEAANRYPVTFAGFPSLHLVSCDCTATIVNWLFPCQRDTILCYLGHTETIWLTWNIWNTFPVCQLNQRYKTSLTDMSFNMYPQYLKN